LAIGVLTGCSGQISEPELDALKSMSPNISRECSWKTKELNVFENPSAFVSFRYALCGTGDGQNFYTQNAGTTIEHAYWDVVFESVHILKKPDGSMDEFLRTLPVRIFTPSENCAPKQISTSFWVLDDGLGLAAEINELPCGMYGRNFAGQTVFEVRDNIVLNYNIFGIRDGIDISSIAYEYRASKP
jgi:hypothetical protein